MPEKLETAQVSINRKMDKQNVAYSIVELHLTGKGFKKVILRGMTLMNL